MVNNWQLLETINVTALRRAAVLGVFWSMVTVLYAADPVVVSVSVDQENIKEYSDSCTGVIEFNIQDEDDDSLIVSIQISADGGATWMVPFQSDFFLTLAPGIHTIPFAVRGGHGDNCIARITAWDRLERSGRARKIPAGGHVFLMGSANGNGNEQPVHETAFTHDFWMDTTEITANQFLQFKTDWVPQYLGQFYYKDNHPVDNCFYHWAIQYCNWRSIGDGLVPCYSNLPEPTDNYREYLDVVCDPSKNGWRLPSEAEWEYVCRAGSTTRYFFGNDSSILGEYAWYLGTADDTIHGVAEKKPNRFGLYDLYGSMLEITQDWYDSSYYESAPFFDPAGPLTYPDNEMSHDPYRVQRGGFFRSREKDVTSSRRIPNFSSARHPQAFRCVRTVLK